MGLGPLESAQALSFLRGGSPSLNGPTSVSPGERPSPCSPGTPSQSCGGCRSGAMQPSEVWGSVSAWRLGLAGWGFEFCVLRRLCWLASASCPVTSVSRLQTQLQELRYGASARVVLSPESCRKARATSCPHDAGVWLACPGRGPLATGSGSPALEPRR